ncbi:MAG: hypothetical protein SGCHY_003292 [Lobulomycetales sp.]
MAESAYLQKNVGSELASALAALHSFGLNSHNDPSHPLKDPIAFLGNYLLEQTRVEQEIVKSQVEREPLVEMMSKLDRSSYIYKSRRKNTLESLAKELEAREVAKESMRKLQEVEEEQALLLEKEASEAAEGADEADKKEEVGEGGTEGESPAAVEQAPEEASPDAAAEAEADETISAANEDIAAEEEEEEQSAETAADPEQTE